MEIQQTITYITLNLSGANYKYAPQKTLNDKYDSLELLYSVPPDKAFIKLIELCLSDRFLYEHSDLRKKVTSHKKGYVPIQEIICLPKISLFVKQINNNILPSKQKILQLIRSFHKTNKIHANLTGIRRRQPFVNKLQNIKPLYIEQYPQNDGCEQLQQLLQATCNIYKINYNHDENWAIIYAQYPQKIVELHGHIWSISTKLKVQNFQKTSNSFNASNICQSLNNYQKLYAKNNFKNKKNSIRQYMNKQFENSKNKKRLPFKNQKFVGNKNRQILCSYKQFGLQQDFMRDQKEQFERLRRFKAQQFEAQQQQNEQEDENDDSQTESEEDSINQSKSRSQSRKQQKKMRERYANQLDGNRQQLYRKMKMLNEKQFKIRKEDIQLDNSDSKNFAKKIDPNKSKQQDKFGSKNIKKQNFQFNSMYFDTMKMEVQDYQVFEYSLPEDVEQYIDLTLEKRFKSNQIQAEQGLMTLIDGVQMYWQNCTDNESEMDMQI